MVGDDDAVRLLDFGIAKLQSEQALTRPGHTLGTAAYMSPEQASGQALCPSSYPPRQGPSPSRRPHARFLRAELEREIGDPDVARHLYEGLIQTFSPPDKIFLTSAYERLGEIHEVAGRRDLAIFNYEKLVRAWKGADAPLQQRREAAQKPPRPADASLRARCCGSSGRGSPGRSRA